MVQTRLELLKNMPIFGGLNDSAIQLILEHSNFVEIVSGEYF